MMIHATWLPSFSHTPSKIPTLASISDTCAAGGVLFIWAESPERYGCKARGRKGVYKRHPFQATRAELAEAQSILRAAATPSNGPSERSEWPSSTPPEFRRVLLLLPSVCGYPQPSPGLGCQATDLQGADPVGERAPLAMDLFQANGVAIAAPDAIRIFSALPDGARILSSGLQRQQDESRIMLGADVRYWSKASKLVLEFVAEQRFLPSICQEVAAGASARKGSPSFRGVWRPVPGEETDVPRINALAQAMPGISRAVLPYAKVRAGGEGITLEQALDVVPSREDLLQSFICTAMDETIRSMLESERSEIISRPQTPDEGGEEAVRRLAMELLGVMSPAHSWIANLAREDSRIRGEESDVRSLSGSVQAWAAQAETPRPQSGFRTCFKLEAPEDPEDVWTLKYLLQAVDDPSVLVPAEKVWEESRGVLRFLGRRFENPQERLLADLARVASFIPQVEESLKDPCPESCQLSSAEAYSFLRDLCPLLQEGGYGALVPLWWDRTRGNAARVGIVLKVGGRSESSRKAADRGVSPARLTASSLVDYDWQVAIGDQVMSAEEFDRLAALKVPLVKARGEWVVIRPEDVEAAIRFWNSARRRRQMSVQEVLSLSLGMGDEVQAQTGLPVTAIEADGWIGELLDRLDSGEKVSELPQPEAFVGKLRPYQIRGYSWLAFLKQWGLGACLADDMGLGKTIQIIALLLSEKESGKCAGPTLLVCPTSVAGNWKRELAKFASSLSVTLHHGSARLSGDEFVREAGQRDVVITTYALLPRDEDTLSLIHWNSIVLDEAQNIKNHGTKQAQSARRLGADFRVALTGTPVENRLSELWSIMDFLNPGYLGSAAGFRQRFATPIERYGDSAASARLRKLTAPFILRRVKTDPLIIRDLPEKHETKVYCTLTKEQATLYEAVVRNMLAAIEEASGMERRGAILAALLKLKQVCNHPAQFLHDNSPLKGRSGKLSRLVEMLDEIVGEGDRALIFTQFAEMGTLLRNYLSKVFREEVLFLHGGVPQKDRDRMIERFQNDSNGPPLFILSLKAGGLGLNLTRASYVFHFDRWWNPAVEDQATDRAFRIGQKKNVNVYKFMCAGTVEERIDQMIDEKRALADSIIGTGEEWITEMSTDELRDIFTLREESVIDDD